MRDAREKAGVPDTNHTDYSSLKELGGALQRPFLVFGPSTFTGLVMSDEMRLRRKRQDIYAGQAKHDERTGNKDTCVREELFRDLCASIYLIDSLAIC